MANQPSDKVTLQQWAAAGGDVPLSFKGREKSWANQVKKFAAGGEVFNTVPDMSDGGQIIDGPAFAGGGIAKLAKSAIGKASGSAGMKAPVVAEKELTTLQDFHTSLGDRIRAEAEAARKMMEGFDYKYDKGQRVFTKDSAAKNRPPYTIIERTRVGNVPMRENMDDLLSKKIIDPETGRAKRTPYEPGYRVRMEHGPEDTWHEFVIPASAILGDVGMKSGGAVHMQAGGIAKLAKSLTGAKKAEDAAKTSLGEVSSMVAKMGEEGRSPIIPVPNRWFLQPDKFPHQQKLIERVLATTGKAREDFPSGAFIDPRTGEVLDSRIMNELGVVIDPKTNRPMMTAKGEAGIERIDPKLGAYTKSNLVRKGLFKPEGGDPLLNDLNFLATIEKGDVGHKYGLATEYASPAELFNTGTGANPTLRPRSRGDLFGVGDVVGQVRVGRSEPHDVYEKLFVAPKGSDVQGVKLSKAKGGEVKMADGGAAFGRYTTGKKYQAAKKRAEEADVNTLADPRTYAFVSGLLGEAPDQLGFSVMHPDYEGIQNVGEKGFMGGTILGVAPAVGPMTKGLPVGASIKPKGGKIPVARTQEEQDVINKFGQKQEQEAARAKRVEKLAQESAAKSPDDQATKPAKSKGKRVKVDADFYRKMAEDKGEAEVLRSARAGEHLKPTPGGYVGAPRTVTSGQALGAMRRAMDKDFQDSVQAVRLADPDRLGTWYDRAKQGIAESAEPYQLPRTLEQHGVYSAGVSPESELGFALKHLNSRVAGEPAMAYRGAPMRNLDTAVAEDRPANMGFKIGEYANKNDPRIPNAGLFGVNDFRRAQGMGYTDPQGNPWKAGVSETMHPFMDAETALQVDRANKAGTGGRTDWAGPHIQEVPWVYGKAQDIHSRGKQGRFGGDELQGIKSALQEANNTARDYMYKHAASATHEAVPGASLGHVPQVLDMTPAQKLEYGRTGRWDMPAPEYALSDMGSVGAGNRDIVYGAAGYRQLPSREAEGLYINRLGGVETNPMTIARPLMDYPTGGGGLMAPESRKMADTLEQFRAFVDAQEAGAYNLPNTMGSVKGKNSLVLDSRKLNPNRLQDPSAGIIPTSQQLADMNKVMEGTGFGVSATNRGVAVFPFDPMMDSKEASKILKSRQKQLTAIYPSTAEKSLTTTGYVPGIGKRSPEGPLSTAPYSGEATGDLLTAFSELHPSVAMNISESEAIRAAIREKALRDAKLGGTRGDIQESRRFFSEADWPKAVEMIRKGASVPAALAALGYSASSMAGENP